MQLTDSVLSYCLQLVILVIVILLSIWRILFRSFLRFLPTHRIWERLWRLILSMIMLVFWFFLQLNEATQWLILLLLKLVGKNTSKWVINLLLSYSVLGGICFKGTLLKIICHIAKIIILTTLSSIKVLQRYSLFILYH